MVKKMRKAALVLLSCALLVSFLFWGKGRSAEGFRASAGFSRCAFSNYDNLDSTDDSHAGYFAEMRNVNINFLKAVAVCAIHEKDWNRFKYHFLEVIVRGKRFRVLALDYCSDKDQGNSCTNNMRHAGANFLVDLEKRTKDYHLPGVGDLQEAGSVRSLGKCNMNWLNGIMGKHGVQWNR